MRVRQARPRAKSAAASATVPEREATTSVPCAGEGATARAEETRAAERWCVAAADQRATAREHPQRELETGTGSRSGRPWPAERCGAMSAPNPLECDRRRSWPRLRHPNRCRRPAWGSRLRAPLHRSGLPRRARFPLRCSLLPRREEAGEAEAVPTRAPESRTAAEAAATSPSTAARGSPARGVTAGEAAARPVDGSGSDRARSSPSASSAASWTAAGPESRAAAVRSESHQPKVGATSLRRAHRRCRGPNWPCRSSESLSTVILAGLELGRSP